MGPGHCCMCCTARPVARPHRRLVEPDMSTPTGGFAAPRDAADAIVDEILRRRLAVEDTRRQDLALPTEAEVEERALLLDLAHLLEDEAGPEAYVQEFVQRRHLTATVPGGAATGEVVISREGLALKPS
ncbi:hypothetical protein, partial [Streptomyces sp. NPDC058861]|uniref:hypothetical protein n=1 Tax=Streptomyces sp. NPDC058861 TaxID=3346653 RepID=UPI00367AFE73